MDFVNIDNSASYRQVPTFYESEVSTFVVTKVFFHAYFQRIGERDVTLPCVWFVITHLTRKFRVAAVQITVPSNFLLAV